MWHLRNSNLKINEYVSCIGRMCVRIRENCAIANKTKETDSESKMS